MAERVLTVRGLDAWYTTQSLLGKKTRRQVLFDVSFSILPGETLGLVGESGSGKTTLAKAVLGLLPGGDVAGEVVHGAPLPQMVFQDPYGSLNPAKTVGWIVEEPLRIAGVRDRAARRERALDALGRVGLEPSLFARRPRELSGGQRQRVSIAAALVRRPALLVADEPVSALDVTVQRQILELLKDLKRDFGLAYLFISHDLNIVSELCDRVLVMREGRIIEENTVRELFVNPRQDYTKRLIADSAGESLAQGEK